MWRGSRFKDVNHAATAVPVPFIDQFYSMGKVSIFDLDQRPRDLLLCAKHCSSLPKCAAHPHVLGARFVRRFAMSACGKPVSTLQELKATAEIER
jgi:hypothetical protein